MPSARFVGIDLAWGDRNASGWAVLRGDRQRVRLDASRTLVSDAEILAALDGLDGDVHVAIDAPLVVPNQTGHRAGDRALATRFARYHAAPHAANRALLGKRGRIRGEALAALLVARGFVHEPARGASARRRFFETYPHPAIVSLLDLPQRLPYKQKPDRTRGDRIAAFATLLDGLRLLDGPRLELPDVDLDPALVGESLKDLKAFEDRVDAIVCAYVAARWTLRPTGCEMFGTLEGGYIVTPVKSELPPPRRAPAMPLGVRPTIPAGSSSRAAHHPR